jgi:NAD(P)-dependent dehydrogenase (short-subunit alcohol dehydrogenase family)
MDHHAYDFAGRIVVISGGTSGIGWYCAQLFAKYGATVLACGHDKAEIEQASSAAPRGVHARLMDVRSEASVAALFTTDALVADVGIDALVNCAGIQRLGAADQTTLDDWNAVMQVNVTGAFLTSKYAVAAMRRRGGGAIVNVSSIHAKVTSGSRVAYVTSKTALLGLTQAMALDHAAEQIRVNVILPGAIDTPMLTQAWAQLRPDRTAHQMRADAGHAIPIGRVGTPAEAAHAVVFLCSPQASFITGAELLVDGGLAHKLALPVTPVKT